MYPHEELCQNYFAFYVNEFGLSKFTEAHEKIMTSDKISGLICRSKYEVAKPTAKHFYYTVPQIPYFFFCKSKTLALGCLFALMRWNDEVNAEYDMIDEQEMYEIVVTIFTRYRVNFGN